MAKTIADLMVETLADAGVERIWGVTGDSLNAMNDSLNRHGGIAWMHTRHEEGAAFSAGAEAAVTGRLSVCAGSCGPGNLHLINGLYDAHRNQVPVLAIAAHIPSAEIGSSYFQETHPTELFRECSHFCELVSDARQMPRMLHRAMSAAVGQRGVAVLVIPGDVALMDAPDGAATRWPGLEPSRSVPSGSEIAELAKLLNGTAKVTLMCGAGCEGAHDAVVALADALQAPIVHSLRGKEHVEWGNAFDVGMTGLIGFSSGFHAMKSCEALLLLGTDFPYRDFYPEGVPIAQVDRNPQALGRRTALTLGIVGDVGAVATALRPLIEPGRSSAWLTTAQAHYREARKDLDALATPRESARPLHPQFVAKTVSALAAEDAVFTADVGTPTVWAARYLTMNGRRRLVGSFNHGSMAGALPQALGAQAAFPERQVVALCGDGGLAMLLGEMLTAVQLNLPVKLVVFDNSVLGFVAMEMKAAGYLDTNVALQNPDFAAMARTMGLGAWRVERSDALEDALRAAFAHPGPALVDVLVASSELAMPPAIKAAQVKGFSLFALRAVMNGRGDELLELAKTNVLR